jgi:16S rRNA (cytosine967-C5)-methyltransferase
MRNLASSRALAATALQHWRTTRDFADAILQRALERTELSAPDRAFAQELFYGILRNLTLLDYWLDCLRRGKTGAVARDILRLGMYQIFLLETPAHAAVFETAALGRKSQRSFVNAVLRSALRQKDELSLRAAAQPISIQFSHPSFLIERWQNEHGQKAAIDLCSWNNQPAPLYARINRARISVQDFVRNHSGSSVVPTRENFVAVPGIPVEALARGECYIQDPGTALACQLLTPKPGDRVLDACAAPGGKIGYVAELMENSGEIVACDRDQHRLALLRENLDRLGITNVRIRQHDWRRGELDALGFDKILLDAPCSNTGVMRRRVDVRWRLRPAEFARMHDQQVAIARAVISQLKPGGVFVYSTCSLEREENEDVIEQLGREFRNLKLDEMKTVLPFRDGFDGALAARFVSR